MDVESRFINSTIILLQDVVLSVVDSFVRLSEAIEETLGDSSHFRDEVNAIIFNLQFEDICKQMSQHTVQILSSMQEDLQHIGLNTGKEDGTAGSEMEKILGKVRNLFTMKEEVQIAHAALNAQNPSAASAEDSSAISEKAKAPSADQDDVLFFDEPGPGTAETSEADQVVFFDEAGTNSPGNDDVVFFDEPPAEEIAVETAVAGDLPEKKSGDKKTTPQDDDNVTFF